MGISRRQTMRGDLPALPVHWKSLGLASTRNRWGICALAGLAGALASALVALARGAVLASLCVPAYAGIKGVWAGVLAAAVVVPATVLGAGRGATERVSS